MRDPHFENHNGALRLFCKNKTKVFLGKETKTSKTTQEKELSLLNLMERFLYEPKVLACTKFSLLV